MHGRGYKFDHTVVYLCGKNWNSKITTLHLFILPLLSLKYNPNYRQQNIVLRVVFYTTNVSLLLNIKNICQWKLKQRCIHKQHSSECRLCRERSAGSSRPEHFWYGSSEPISVQLMKSSRLCHSSQRSKSSSSFTAPHKQPSWYDIIEVVVLNNIELRLLCFH